MTGDSRLDSPESAGAVSTTAVFGNQSWVQKLIWIFVILAGLYGLYQAISLAWVCDDAFISFRYAKNLIDGHGLVFNIGERVEGYSNFLWTIMIAGAMLFGSEPILFAQVVGIVSYIFTFLILVFISVRLSRQSKAGILVIPIAAVAIMLQFDSQVWATSGLETAWVTALVTLAFAILIMAESKKYFLLAGVVLILAVLSRPDMMIFYITALPYILLQSKRPVNNFIYYLLPLLIIFLPYWIIRFLYYGYIFPNAYYAKLAYLPWYTQGLIYLWIYLKTNYSLLLLILVIPLIISRLTARFKKEKCFDSRIERAWLLGILFVGPFTFYLVRIGGDFMHARFFIPMTPICFLILETAISEFVKKSSTRYIISIGLALSVLFRWEQFPEERYSISGIYNEFDSYKAEDIERARIDGERLGKYLLDKKAVVGFQGGKAKMIYYSELPAAVNYKEGLTDEYIAHIPYEDRGRFGHERGIVEKYMAERKINFLTIDIGPVTPNRVGVISFDGTILPIKHYDAQLMEELKKYAEVEFVDFVKFLDDYISSINRISTRQLQADYEQFRDYYFSFNDDPERQNIFVRVLEDRMKQSSQ